MPFFFPCIRCWDCGISQCNPKHSFIKFVHEQLPKREQLLRQENSRQIRMIQLKCRSILTANVTSPAAELPEDITADAAPTEQPVGTPPQPNILKQCLAYTSCGTETKTYCLYQTLLGRNTCHSI